MPRPSVEAERRRQILDATCAVIAKSGLRQLRVSDVATAAGISSGMVHYYFDTKDELVSAAFEFNFAE
jgi:AcrR family transcriptional regulator